MENTHLELHIYLVLEQPLQRFMEVSPMLGVIQVQEHEDLQYVMKGVIKQSLEVSNCISQLQWHHQEGCN